MDAASTSPFSLNEFTVEPRRNCIRKGEDEQRIEYKVMEVLLCLVRHEGAVVSKEEILDQVWTDVYVGEEVVSRAISELRKVFGDSPKHSSYIETIPKKGYRLIVPVRRPASRSAPRQATSGFTRRMRERAGMAVLLLVITGAAVAATFVLWDASPPGSTIPRIVPVSSYQGDETDPALSPDGSRVAFSWNGNPDRHQNIYVKLLGEEKPLQLTDSRLYEFSPAWSPDGSRIAFARFFEGLFMVSSLGGPEEKLADIGRFSQPSLDWSPDGNHIVFSDRATASDPYRLHILDVRDHSRRILATPDNTFMGDDNPRFSPDGRRVAFLRGTNYSNDLYVTVVGSGQTDRLTHDNRDIRGLAWSNDGEHLFFTSNRGGAYGLWRFSFSGQRITPYNLGTGNITQLATSGSADDNTLVFVHTDEEINIHRIRLNEQPSSPGILLGSTQIDRDPRYSPDGRSVTFISHRSGSPELWVSDSDGNQLRKLTSFGGPYLAAPSWSPDGRKIAFELRSEGSSDLHIYDLERETERPLIQSEASELLPRFSNDGERVYFTSNRSGSWQIWKTDLNGEDRRQVTRQGGYASEEGPEGALYYTKITNPGLFVSQDGTGTERKLFDLTGFNRANWALNREGIWFIGFSEGRYMLQWYEFGTGDLRTVQELDREVVWYQAGLTVSPDGTSVLITRTDRKEQDIVSLDRY